MLGVAPPGFMRGNEASAHLFEGHDLGRRDRCGGLQLPPVFARIDALGDYLAVLDVHFSGPLERDVLGRPYANPPLLAGDRVTARPRLRFCAADFDVEAMLIVVLAGTERPGISGAGLFHL